MYTIKITLHAESAGKEELRAISSAMAALSEYANKAEQAPPAETKEPVKEATGKAIGEALKIQEAPKEEAAPPVKRASKKKTPESGSAPSTTPSTEEFTEENLKDATREDGPEKSSKAKTAEDKSLSAKESGKSKTTSGSDNSAPTKEESSTLREEIRGLLSEKVADNREAIKKRLAAFDAKNVTRLEDRHLAAFKTFMQNL